ncbi:MAG: pyridoxamine 5'-phosphate oxidase family protein [Brevinematia bacterium]
MGIIKLPLNVIEFLKENGGICILGTVSKFGIVNLSPRFLLEVDSDNIVFGSGLPNKTLFNLNQNNKVCIAKWDTKLQGNIRFVMIIGTAENYKDGEIYERISKKFQELGFPKPLAVTVVKIEDYTFYGG